MTSSFLPLLVFVIMVIPAQLLAGLFILGVELFEKAQTKIFFSVVFAIGALAQFFPQSPYWNCSMRGFPAPSSVLSCGSGYSPGELRPGMLLNLFIFVAIAIILSSLFSNSQRLNIKWWKYVVVVCAEIGSISIMWLVFHSIKD